MGARRYKVKSRPKSKVDNLLAVLAIKIAAELLLQKVAYAHTRVSRAWITYRPPMALIQSRIVQRPATGVANTRHLRLLMTSS